MSVYSPLSTAVPTAAGSVPAASAALFLFADGTTLTGTQVATMLGVGSLALPGAPSAPVQGSTGTTTMALAWSVPSTGGAAASYILQQRPTGSGSYVTVASPPGTSASLTGLTAATGYDFQVAAVNATGTGPFSPVLVNALTSATLAAPGAVTGLALSASTASSITLGWTESGGTPSTRTVTQRTPSGSGSYVAAAGTFTATGGAVTGLAAGTAYDFQVVESNATGTSAASTLLNVTTAAAPAVPNAVTALAAGTATSTTIPLTWTESGGAPTTRTVTQRTPAGSGSYVASAGTFGATGGTVTGLVASSAYDFQVVESNATGTSAATALLNTSTAAAAAQSILVNTVATPATNSFYPASGTYANVVPAALDFSTDGGTTWSAAISPTISGGTYSFTALSLAAGTYTLKVRDHTNTTIIGTSASFTVPTSAAITYAVIDVPAAKWSATSALTLPTSPGYVGYGSPLCFVRGPTNQAPASAVWALGTSSTVAPTSTATQPSDYGVTGNDHGATTWFGNQATYPQALTTGVTMYIYKNGNAVGTRTLYLWMIPTDGSGPAAVFTLNGTPFALTVNYT